MSSQLREVDLGNGRNQKSKAVHMQGTRAIGPNEELVNYINFVAKQLDEYNHKVAKITHQEHLLNN